MYVLNQPINTVNVNQAWVNYNCNSIVINYNLGM